MCLTKKYKTECKVAKSDIVCYKVVYKPSSVMKSLILGKRLTDFHFISLYQNYFYTIGFRYIEPSFDSNAGETVTKGFHSYVEERVAHAILMTIAPNMPDNVVMLRCTIPAGARYWVGNIGADFAPCCDDPTRKNYAELCSEKIRVLAWKWGGKQHKWNKTTRAEWWPNDNLRKYVSGKK